MLRLTVGNCIYPLWGSALHYLCDLVKLQELSDALGRRIIIQKGARWLVGKPFSLLLISISTNTAIREDGTCTRWLQLQVKCHIQAPECRLPAYQTSEASQQIPPAPHPHLFQVVFTSKPLLCGKFGRTIWWFMQMFHIPMHLDFFFNCWWSDFDFLCQRNSGGCSSGWRHCCWINQLLGEFLINT